MMTQRPVTGSFRSSGIECVLVDLDGRLAPLELDRHDIEPEGTVDEMVPRQVVGGKPHDSAPLSGAHRFDRLSIRVPPAGLDLDEYGRPSIAGDDVQFATGHAVAP